ncbi:hypothetical protein JQC91_15790 [Jannaschia sp. Os4]|uniref:hypothetical protein n=1 Tax=Jannaschia sp. Os4 TaxID=2807617 RepID=UPI001939B4D4|nr:hypothetical protein [Jannaschia sp. Os4]MBM2577769.1 hypothetical protein [Jannaschia sp. Os4]
MRGALRAAGLAAAVLLAACEPPQPGPQVGEDGRPVTPFGASPSVAQAPTPTPIGATRPAPAAPVWDGVIRDADDPQPVTLPPPP